jgi:RNA polymerase sigma factor (sigma-70 family)
MQRQSKDKEMNITNETIESWFKMYNNHLVNLLRRYVDQIEDAEELAQEVWCKVCSMHRSANNDTLLPPILASCAHTIAVDFLRHKVHERNYKCGIRELPTTDDHGIAKYFINQESRDKVAKAISDLPLMMQQAIYFKYYENLKYKEIASKLGVPEHKVQRLLAQAKALLSVDLKELEDLV